MKTRLYCLICMFVACGAYADSTPTSKHYVDSVLLQKEGIMNAKSVDTLVTYPKTGGDAVERPIKSSITDTSTTDASVVTAGAANTKIETKQDKVIKASDRIVMTYSDTDGVTYGRAVYDATDNQWSNGVVTAQTLNDAVVAAVNSELTPVEGIGWRINTEPTTLDFVDTNPPFQMTNKTIRVRQDFSLTVSTPSKMAAGMLGQYPVINDKMKLTVPGNKVCSIVPPPADCNQRGCVTNQNTSWDYTVPGTYTIYYYCPTVFGTFVYTGRNVSDITTSGDGNISCDPNCSTSYDLWPAMFGLDGVRH